MRTSTSPVALLLAAGVICIPSSALLENHIHGAPEQQREVPANVRGACAAVAAVLAGMPSLEIVPADTTVVDPRTQYEAWGCTYAVTGSMSMFRGADTPDERVREALAALGWREDWDYGADGPDGTAYAFRSGPVICYFRGSWDGGDITDSTYVPEDWYQMSAGCIEAAEAEARFKLSSRILNRIARRS